MHGQSAFYICFFSSSEGVVVVVLTLLYIWKTQWSLQTYQRVASANMIFVASSFNPFYIILFSQGYNRSIL